MKQGMAVALALAFSVQAHAELSASDQVWLESQGITGGITETPEQEDGLHWLINNDCRPGKAKVAGLEIECKGDRKSDVNYYLGVVSAMNFVDAVKKNARPEGAPPVGDPLTPSDYAYVKTLDRNAARFSPVVMTLHNRAALHRLIGSVKGESAPKKEAVNYFLDSITMRVDGDQLDSIDKQEKWRAQLAAYMTKADRDWLTSQKIAIPLTARDEVWTVGQVKGLHWLINNDCKPGKMKVGGIDLDCTGDKVSDVNDYIGMVGATFFYVMSNDGA